LLGHGHIGTEHLLLGLIREEEGVAARVLESLGLALDDMREEIEKHVGKGDEHTDGQIPFAPRCKRALELALSEARDLGDAHVGTEHVLLGLCREGEGVAGRILVERGADPATVRNEVMRTLSRKPLGPVDPPPSLSPEAAEEWRRLQAEKEAAIEAQELERAKSIREAQRRLTPRPPVTRVEPRVRRRERRAVRPPVRKAVVAPVYALALGWVLFGVAFGLGLLVGWLVWD
jgi:ATP-dependent Clp protease ATP-binding subunit ClpA